MLDDIIVTVEAWLITEHSVTVSTIISGTVSELLTAAKYGSDTKIHITDCEGVKLYLRIDDRNVKTSS
jgi:hypothetical protein